MLLLLLALLLLASSEEVVLLSTVLTSSKEPASELLRFEEDTLSKCAGFVSTSLKQGGTLAPARM